MILDDIILSVTDKVQDDSFTEDAILNLINECRAYVAAEVDLPALQKSAALTTLATESSVALPANYLRNIYWVGSVGQKKRIGTRPGDYYNMLTFLESYPVVAGQIERVCVEGDTLLYNGMADDSLIIKYYAMPPAITDTMEEPSEIPAHMHRPLLVSYCCKEIFNEIEDGIEGQKVNTDKWEIEFAKAMMSLKTFVERNKPREAKYTRDMS